MQRDDLNIEQAFKVCSMLTIDLCSAIDDDKKEINKLDSWIKFYEDSGFTEKHPFFNIPIQPH